MSYQVKAILVLVLSATAGWLLVRVFITAAIQKLLHQDIGKLIQGLGNELFDANVITGKLTDPTLLQELHPLIEKHIDTFLVVKLTEKLPFVATFMGESTLAKIKEGMIEEINLLLPSVMAQYSRNLGEKLDISHIITSKISAMPAQRLESIVNPYIQKQQLKLQLAGAGLGLVIGSIAVIIFSL